MLIAYYADGSEIVIKPIINPSAQDAKETALLREEIRDSAITGRHRSYATQLVALRAEGETYRSLCIQWQAEYWHTPTIPLRRTANYCVWVGDIARTIAANL